jgi:hypothetical protein
MPSVLPQVGRYRLNDQEAQRAQDEARQTINQNSATLAKTNSTVAAQTAVGVIPSTQTGPVLFDASQTTHFSFLLTGNCTASIVGLTPGVVVTFILQQDNTGGHTFTWPSTVNNLSTSSVRGAGTIGATANKASSQRFVFDGSTLWAVSAMVTGL